MVCVRSSHPFFGRFFARAFGQHFDTLTYHLSFLLKRDPTLKVDDTIESVQSFPLRQVAFHLGSLRPGTGRITVGKSLFETDFFHQIVGIQKIRFGFSWKANQDVRSDSHAGNHRSGFFNELEVFFSGVHPIHP